jgi:signal transduction histidine kinase
MTRFDSQSPPGRVTFTSKDAVTVRADPNVLHAAVDNIVRNALIHADAQLPIEMMLTQDARDIHIAVRDHGQGVPEAELARIFEPFYRAGRVDAKHVSADGTGIGLAITQRAAALHGGRIVAQNAQNGGLIVTLTLPRTDADIGAAGTATS